MAKFFEIEAKYNELNDAYNAADAMALWDVAINREQEAYESLTSAGEVVQNEERKYRGARSTAAAAFAKLETAESQSEYSALRGLALDAQRAAEEQRVKLTAACGAHARAFEAHRVARAELKAARARAISEAPDGFGYVPSLTE